MNYSEWGAELLPDGTLQMRDPCDNTHTRHQYRVEAGLLFRKRLPDGDQGEGEREEPKWLMVKVPAPGTPVHEYWKAHGGRQ